MQVQIQINRLSPHQNGKVFGVLTAIVSFIILVPFILMQIVLSPKDAAPLLFVLLLLPLIYMPFSYAIVVGICRLYNYMYRRIGGIELGVTITGA